MQTFGHWLTYLVTNWTAVAGGLLTALVILATVVNVIRNPDKSPGAPPLLVQIIDALALFAPKGRVSIGNTRLSLPLMKSRKKGLPSGSPPSGPVAILCLFLSALASCGYCQLPEHAKDAQCIALRVVTDCGAPEVIKIVIDIAASVGQAIASSDYANLLAAIETDLKNRGVTDTWGVITCALNQHSGPLTGKSKATPADQRASAWKKAHPAKVINPYGAAAAK